jgi:cytidylate kinase
MNRITIITGSPGTGKSTVSALLAANSPFEKSVHMHTDDFFHYLKKGMIPPYLPESNSQNNVVIRSFMKAAIEFANAGYDVIVDGIIGPWFLAPWKEAATEYKGRCEINYFILRATKEETLFRAKNRLKLSTTENSVLVEQMWHQFTNLAEYEAHVIDSTELDEKNTAALLASKIGEAHFKL